MAVFAFSNTPRALSPMRSDLGFMQVRLPLPATYRRHRCYMPKPQSCTFSSEWGAEGAWA